MIYTVGVTSAGTLGVKSGKGFFDHGGRSTVGIVRGANVKLSLLHAFLKQLGEL